jgi:hypothetical protein
MRRKARQALDCHHDRRYGRDRVHRLCWPPLSTTRSILNSPYAPPATPFLPSAPSAAALRRYGAAVFAAPPLLVLLVLVALAMYQALTQAGNGRGAERDIVGPIFVFVPIAAMTGACGYAFALECAHSSRSGIVRLGLTIGAVWTLGAVAGGNLLAGGTESLGPAALTALSIEAVQAGAFLLPVALLACMLVRRHGGRGGVPGAGQASLPGAAM